MDGSVDSFPGTTTKQFWSQLPGSVDGTHRTALRKQESDTDPAMSLALNSRTWEENSRWSRPPLLTAPYITLSFVEKGCPARNTQVLVHD